MEEVDTINIKDCFETERLLLTKVTVENTSFIYELVNTRSWIKYIGEKNIKTLEDAEKYIEKLLSNSKLTYWVVQLKTTNTELGIITFMKRGYLDHYDLGFAFMPEYTKKGYAFEAAKKVLNYANRELKMSTILAITLECNSNSIELLEKLGFNYNNEIENESEKLLLYSTKASNVNMET